MNDTRFDTDAGQYRDDATAADREHNERVNRGQIQPQVVAAKDVREIAEHIDQIGADRERLRQKNVRLKGLLATTKAERGKARKERDLAESERDSLAKDLAETKTEWHARYVTADQARMAAVAERKELVGYLWACMKWAGADTSYADNAEHAYQLGHLGDNAVEAVKELRKDYDECPTPEDLTAATSHRERLETALRAMLDVAGASHLVEEGPNAGWVGEGENIEYNEDLIPAPNCAVCKAEKLAREALNLSPTETSDDDR